MIGFIIAIIALTGQSIFGSAFPTNPITSQTFNYVNNCGTGDIVCIIAFYGGIFLSTILIPLQIIGYLWAIMIFMMTSPTIWWLGVIIFVPAGIVFCILLAYILLAVAQAVATLIHFI